MNSGQVRVREREVQVQFFFQEEAFKTYKIFRSNMK